MEPTAIAISMDGFHLSRSILDLLSNASEAYARRGAPWTFDVSRIINLVRRLRESTTIPSTSREPIFCPTFDHELKDPVTDGTVIGSSVSIIILEGNYLLLDENEWREISKLVDLRVYIDIDNAEASNRVSRRHVAARIEATIEDGERRFDENDGVNGFLIRERMIEATITVKSIAC